jgi:hypothetical protein
MTYHCREDTHSTTCHSPDHSTYHCRCGRWLSTGRGNDCAWLRCNGYSSSYTTNLTLSTATGRPLAIHPVADIRRWATDDICEGRVAVRVLGGCDTCLGENVSREADRDADQCDSAQCSSHGDGNSKAMARGTIKENEVAGRKLEGYHLTFMTFSELASR